MELKEVCFFHVYPHMVFPPKGVVPSLFVCTAYNSGEYQCIYGTLINTHFPIWHHTLYSTDGHNDDDVGSSVCAFSPCAGLPFCTDERHASLIEDSFGIVLFMQGYHPEVLCE